MVEILKSKKIIATCIAAVMLLSMVACSSKTSETTEASGSEVDATETVVTESTVADTDDNVAPTETTEDDFDFNDYSFDEIYGSQLMNYVNHQYYFDGQPVPKAESNFYFINAFYELSRLAQYGYYPLTSEGYIDLSAEIELEEGVDAEVEFNNYGELFVAYAEKMLESTCIICKLANEDGLALADSTIAEIDELLANLEAENAIPYGVSLDDYFALYYGEDCTAAAFRQVMCNYYLADLYTKSYIENFEFTDAQLSLFTGPNIRYALYAVMPDATDEEKAAVEAVANDILEQCNGDIDTFAVVGQASYQTGVSLQYGEIVVPYGQPGQTVQAFEDWALDESRQEGDLEVIYAPEYGYFVVGYVGVFVDEEIRDSIGVESLSNYTRSLAGTDGYLLMTNDVYLPASPVETTEPTDDASDDTPVDATQASDSASTEGTTSVLSQDSEDKSDNKAASKIVLIVLASVGGVAILSLAGVGIASIVKGSKKEKSSEEEEE